MKKLKIKVITGFREDQYYTIDAEEAHKAYYLFSHPEERGVFDNGVALVGKNIQGIEPDFNATMGWNPTHRLESEDWNEIRGEGVDRSLRNILHEAKLLAQSVTHENRSELLARRNFSTVQSLREQNKIPALQSMSEIIGDIPKKTL